MKGNKQNNYALNSVKDNSNSNIIIVNNIGETDRLSPLEIYKNANSIEELENEFSNRIGYSCSILSNSLPKELQNDFEIKSRLVNNKLEYFTNPKTKDAYEKHPIRMNFKMKFNNENEATNFRKNGIAELQREANKTRKPVKIQNITDLREFIGDFEDPTSYINNRGCDGIELYIMPKPFPKANDYSIEVFNNDYNFKIENTKLRISEILDNGYLINNSESTEEPFNISIKIWNDDKCEKDKKYKGKLNISISLKDELKNDCYYNLELSKFAFIMKDLKSNLIIKNNTKKSTVFNINNCGKIEYDEKDYIKFKEFNDLIENVIYIEKINDMHIDYDYKYFLENEDLINIITSSLKGKEYKIKKLNMWSFYISDYDNEKYKNIEIKISPISLFNKNFKLKEHKLLLEDCEFIKLENDGTNTILTLKSDNVIFKPEY